MTKNQHHSIHLEQLETRLLLNASLSKSGVWSIMSENNKAQIDDDILIQTDPINPNQLMAIVNNAIVDTQSVENVSSIQVKSGNGDDTITINLPESLNHIPVKILAGKGNDEIQAGPGNDYLHGGPGHDHLMGNAGDDILIGSNGNDQLDSGSGNDFSKGGKGHDILTGDENGNKFSTGSGKDYIFSYSTEDKIRKGKKDIVIFQDDVTPIQNNQDTTQIKSDIINSALDFWSWIWDTEGKSIPLPIFDFGGVIDFPGGIFPAADASAEVAGDGAGFVSQTNTQEIDVDEADLVKTDGDYLYVLVDELLTIIDVQDPENLEIVSEVEIEGYAGLLYLNDGEINVISQIYSNYGFIYPLDPFEDTIFAADAIVGGPIPPGEIIPPQVKVTSIDVSAPESPNVTEERLIDGWLESSRLINDTIHIVVENSSWLPTPTSVWDPTNRLISYESQEDYKQRLEDNLESYLPSITTKIFTDGSSDTSVDETKQIQLSDISVPDDFTTTDLTSIVSINTKDDTLSTTSITGFTGEIYASSSSLYIASNSGFLANDTNQWIQTTTLYKFDLDENGSEFSASGTVPGVILNQFSMDEEDGYFRIATTTGNWQSVDNALFVLEQDGDELEIVGSITEIAPGERIQSVRFMDDEAFVVTFERVDPLFAIDLTNPELPVIKGELKIPGFSEYLHPANNDQLIGVGYDADENGRNLELQMSLFDVSDLTNPQLKDTIKFTDTPFNDYTEAVYDHHAFSYFSDTDIVALPVHTGFLEPSTLQVVEINPIEGFDLRGTITHDSAIRRSLKIDDMLLSISESQVKVHQINDLSEISSIEL